MKCWVCVDSGKVGTFKQAQALAKNWLGAFEHKEIHLPWWCRWMPPQLFRLLPKSLQYSAIRSLGKNYPNIIITAGRQAILVALALRKVTKTIVLMNPKISPSLFNVVIAPQHDQLIGANVIHTTGALHDINIQTLTFPKYLEQYQKPRIVLLLGGTSIHGKYSLKLAKTMADDIKKFINHNPSYKSASLLITPSRRTPKPWLKNFLKSLWGLSLWCWDETTPNPYPHFLKDADIIIVCEDSISMASEACSTGIPVLIYPTNLKKAKFKNFYQALFTNHHAQAFTANTEIKIPTPLKGIEYTINKIKYLINDI